VQKLVFVVDKAGQVLASVLTNGQGDVNQLHLQRREGELRAARLPVPLRSAKDAHVQVNAMKRILVLAPCSRPAVGPPATIIVNGREVNYDDAANDVLRRGKQALEGGPHRRGAQGGSAR